MVAGDRAQGAIAQHHKIAHETDARQRHEDDGHPFDALGVEVRKACVVRGKPAQAHGGAHVHEGIGPAHTRPAVSGQTGQREQKVHPPQTASSLGDPRRELGVFHGSGGFGLVQLHTAQAEQGQHRHHQQHDAQTANKLQKAAPDIDRYRQLIEPRQRRCAGGRQRAHGLEIGPAPADIGHAQVQRQGRVGRQHQPDQVDQHKAVARQQLAPMAPGEPPQQQAAEQGQGKTSFPDQLIGPIVFKPGPDGRHQKSKGEGHDHA